MTLIGKMGRKTGVGIGLATQLPSVAELGGSMVIRSMVSSGNVVVFRTADRLTGQMAFSGALPVDPARLPREFPPAVPGGPPRPSSGLGFLLGPSARTAPWRNYYVADPYHWATTRPDLGLEAAAAADAGEDYATRHQRAAGDDATCPTPAGDGPPPSARLAPVVPLTTAAGPVPQPAGRRRLREGTATDTVVALLTRHGETGRGDLIAASGYSPRAVTDALAALVEAGRVTKTGHGRYRLTGDPPLA